MIAPNVFIGVAGWSHPDWQDLLIPSFAPQTTSPLSALSRLFDLIEITTSYYHPPDAKTVQHWLEQTRDNSRLHFTVRVWQKLVREKSLSWKTDAATVQRGLLPLLQAQRLAALVLPFSPSFRHTDSNEEWLWRLRDAFAGWPLVVELLHDSWQQSALLPRLPSLNIAVAVVDQPQREEKMPAPDFDSNRRAYWRLNGRNRLKWLDQNADRDERFDYFYSAEEMAQLATIVRSMSNKAQSCYIVFHNHPRGQALANALQLFFALTGQKIDVPKNLCRHFPELEALAAGPAAQQVEMFSERN